MYLSRVQINPARRGGRHLLASRQRLHAAVLASFPDPPTGSTPGPRVLWRLDRERERVWLYVSSPGRPDFHHVVEQAGWPAAEQTWLTRDYDPFLEKLDVGQRWRFRLDANPVHKVRITDAETDTRRRAMLGVEMREKWLLRKGDLHGFRVATARSEDGADIGPALTLTGRDVSTFERRTPDGEAGHSGSHDKPDAKDCRRRPVTIARTTYEGILEVVDADALRSALVRGIGPAKGYGCGLLTLAEV